MARQARVWARQATGCRDGATSPPEPRHAYGTADLVSYWGGRYRLMRVRDVAEQLGVCNATVYRLVEAGEIRHVRIVNSIRIRPDHLEEFVRNGLMARADREG